ncbi:MAG: glycosyltransferase [Rhodobacterales bacterium]
MTAKMDQSKKRIAMLANNDITFVRYRGGVIAKLLEAGYDVNLTALSATPSDIEAGCFAPPPVPVGYLDTALDKKRLFTILKGIKEVSQWLGAKKPDVIFVQNAASILLLGLVHFIFRLKTPMIVLVEGLGRGFDRSTRPFWRLALGRASGVIFLNEDDPKQLRAAGVLKPGLAMFQVPGIGIDVAAFAPSEIPNGSPNVLMIARLIDTKHPLDFCKAAQICKQNNVNATFTLIYECQRGERSIPATALQKYAKDVTLIKGPVPVKPYLEACSFLSMPSEKEGFPVTVMEAAASGRASLVSSDATLKGVVNSKTGWTFELGDVEDFAHRITEILQNGSFRAKGKNTRAYALTHYNRAKMDMALFEIIEQCRI